MRHGLAVDLSPNVDVELLVVGLPQPPGYRSRIAERVP
jgi:hypothetical protein